MWALLVVVLASPLWCNAQQSKCNARKYDHDSIVCVCNAKICDYVADPGPIAPGTFLHYQTTRSGDRLSLRKGSFTDRPADEIRDPKRTVVIKADPTRIYQEVLGFGGAISDSAGFNIASLSWATQGQLLRQYYGEGGIDYTFLRVPIGGSDFSTYNYTYLDTEDDTMGEFKLVEDDFKYKIPYVKWAQKLSRTPIKLFASAWSSPEWMKELRNGTIGFTRLKRQYYQHWANYYIKFFDEYKKEGLEFWGLTAQNEPFHGTIVYFAFNSLGWTPEEQRDWIAGYLGPALHRNGYGDLKLIMLDDQRTFLPDWPTLVMEDPDARKYISGVGIHWYWDYLNITAAHPERTLSATHYLFPDKFLLYTESCNIPFTPRGSSGVMLGNWERAENYSTNIIEDMNHWVTGWVDWNMALDLKGGPNWADNYVDSPIIVNASANEFYKQPMFYSLAHFSKFVPPGSKRIHTQLSSLTMVETVAFLKPDNSIAYVILNRLDDDVDVFLKVSDDSYAIVRCEGHSIHTVLYNDTKPKGSSPPPTVTSFIGNGDREGPGNGGDRKGYGGGHKGSGGGHKGSGNGDPWHGNRDPWHGNREPGHGNRYPGHGNRDPGHGNRDHWHGNGDPWHGNEDPWHGNEDPWHGNEDPWHGNEDPWHGNGGRWHGNRDRWHYVHGGRRDWHRYGYQGNRNGPRYYSGRRYS